MNYLITALAVYFLVLGVGGGYSSAEAEDLELVTDRPDQTESTTIVPKGYAQVETGWTFSRDKTDGQTTQTTEFPGTLSRIGIFDGVEARLGWGGYSWQDADGQHNILSGGGDMNVGAKIHLWDERNFLPEGAFLTTVSLPSGSEAFSSQGVDPSFRFNMSHTLSPQVSLGYNLGASWDSSVNDDKEDKDRAAVLNYTTSLGMSLTEKMGMFVEFFGDIPLNARGGPQNSFDGGLTYLLKPNVQLDASAGFGISSDANDFFTGAGISIRWPH